MNESYKSGACNYEKTNSNYCSHVFIFSCHEMITRFYENHHFCKVNRGGPQLPYLFSIIQDL